jgi:hypothetical protein
MNKQTAVERWRQCLNPHIAKEKFTGQLDNLKGYIYDVTTSKDGVAYTCTTEEIARYVGKKNTTTGT